MNEAVQAHALHQKKQKKKPLLKRLTPYLMLVPTIVAYGMWCYFPFIKSVILSMTITTARGDIKKWVWFDNFIRLFKSAKTWKIIGNTFEFALVIGIGTILIAMVLSLLSVRKTRLCRVYQTMYALPMAVASVTAATAFTMLFKQDGLVNIVTGLRTNWFLQENTALWAVALATIWLSIGSSFLFLLVGFRNVPLDLIESSKVDGANGLRRIMNILIPCASPQIFFVIFLNINSSFKSFVMIRQLTAGGPNNSTMVLVYDIYLNAMKEGRFETACAEAIILCVIIIIFQRIQFHFEDKLVVY